MCTNFRPPTSRIVADMRGLEGVQPPAADWPEEAFPGYLAPIVVRQPAGHREWADSRHIGQRDNQPPSQPHKLQSSRPNIEQRSPTGSSTGNPTGSSPGSPLVLQCLLARFGLVPRWSRDAVHAAELARRTHNARSETVAERPSFRTPWRERQYALVPMLNYFEPCWESGRAERWRIAGADGEPFAVAALHERWTDRDTGEQVHSFSLLTVNADPHPLMARMHRPGDEKRMLVIVPPGQYAHWLQATPGDAEALLRHPPQVLLAGAPEPRTPTPARRPANVPAHSGTGTGAGAGTGTGAGAAAAPVNALGGRRDRKRDGAHAVEGGELRDGVSLPAQRQLDF